DKAAFDSQGTFALRPLATAVKSGTYFFATDTGVTYRSDGTVWSVVGKRPALDVTATELGDEIVNEEKLTDGVLRKLGLTDTEAVRRGKSIVAPEELRTSTAYGLMPTPDRVQNIALPSDGLIAVLYEATWKQGSSSTGSAAIFVGSSQLQTRVNNNASLVAQSALCEGGDNIRALLVSYPGGLMGSGGASGTSVPVPSTTGQPVAGCIGSTSQNTQQLGGPCYIFAAAGTYDVSIQFKSTSGGVWVRDRKLWVWTMDF
ncbi:MAG: hypothetical protein JHC87_08685, partial [Thermoleophilaceae bacterium]|nr:hypothetical protein [Thermoleophilaceae bacterium]